MWPHPPLSFSDLFSHHCLCPTILAFLLSIKHTKCIQSFASYPRIASHHYISPLPAVSMSVEALTMEGHWRGAERDFLSNFGVLFLDMVASGAVCERPGSARLSSPYRPAPGCWCPPATFSTAPPTPNSLCFWASPGPHPLAGFLGCGKLWAP